VSQGSERGGVPLDGMGGLRRSHACGALRTDDVGREVTVAGWVHRRRDHGGVCFVDLRDRDGVVQVVFKPEVAAEAHRRADAIRTEFVLLVRGIVEPRTPDTVNPRLPTGEVEVTAHELRILNAATPPPFAIEEDSGADESVRLRHRIHDLRRPPLQHTLRVRHLLCQSARRALSELGFLEIETPMLARATPEGARDFLVPSRLQPGSFYALPQSPQILKQLLMVAGFDRYFQIARCFRDEDLRADRQPEFTQIDLEMSFTEDTEIALATDGQTLAIDILAHDQNPDEMITEYSAAGVDDVLEVLEEVTARAFQEAAGATLERPFRRMTHAEAMSRYGSDKPDTRVLLELVELTDLFAESGFRAFRTAVDRGGIVKCLPIHDAAALSRGEIDRLESFVRKELGARGLAWIRVVEDGSWQSPIAKFLSEAEREGIAGRTGARPGSVVFFAADDAGKANAILARLRTDLGRKLGRVEDRPWDVLLLVDFPLFEKDDSGRITYCHQPFVAPVEEDLALLESDPLSVRGTHYDVVANGLELGSGSLRNHRSDVQRRIFEVLGYPKAEAEARFGFLLNALDAGAPPHGGFAFGLDRMAMVLAGAESLRDVIAFPKTQRGLDLLMDAPSGVDPEQLAELALRLQLPETGKP